MTTMMGIYVIRRTILDEIFGGSKIYIYMMDDKFVYIYIMDDKYKFIWS